MVPQDLMRMVSIFIGKWLKLWSTSSKIAVKTKLVFLCLKIFCQRLGRASAWTPNTCWNFLANLNSYLVSNEEEE